MTSKLPLICDACKHKFNEGGCVAFPKEIPLKPLQRPMLHDEILPGQDNDVVFERDENNLRSEMLENFVRELAAE